LERNLRSMRDVESQKLSVVPQTVFLKSKSIPDLTSKPSRLASYSRSSPTDSVMSTTNSSTIRTAHRPIVGSTDEQKTAPAVGSSNTIAVGLLEAPSKMRAEGSPE
jgi:phosphoinositide-3-kinase regulatory subunit 4